MGDGHSWTAPKRSAPRPRPSAGTAFVALGAGQGRGTHPKAGMAARAHASTARDVAIVGGESETDLGCANSTTPAALQREKTEREKKLLARASSDAVGGNCVPRFDERSVYVRWTMVRIEERGRPPALHANATAPSRRRLGAVVAIGTQLSCATVRRHRKSEPDVRYSLALASTCARAKSAKKRAGAVFSGQRRLNRPQIALLTCRALPS